MQDGRIGTAQIQFCYESKDAHLRDILGGDVPVERHEQFLIADFLYDEKFSSYLDGTLRVARAIDDPNFSFLLLGAD